MNHENLIISNEWYSDDKGRVKIIHQRQESIYLITSEVRTAIYRSNSNSIYFVFDDDEIVLMYNADTGMICPIHVNEENVLCVDKRCMRKNHVWYQFTRFLFGEFLRNCGINQ